MKTLILRSALIAAVFAPLSMLFQLGSMQHTRYDPPIGFTELKDMRYEDAMARMKARERPINGFQSLGEAAIHGDLSGSHCLFLALSRLHPSFAVACVWGIGSAGDLLDADLPLKA